ncbi:macro domain-containing protein [Spirochaetia bacterium 38H-sp]|uniref:Macro domain-containing protein n=1 Tax=Rarispira pelagica TaxID=3141764 RepID=A0ABU9UA94_9SPIR
MASIEYKSKKIETRRGDISHQPDLEAIVNAANAMLLPGSGVAGAIHSAAGNQLAEECRHLAPISPGQAVITSGYNLPNRYVIHTLGPVFGRDKPEAEILANCYKNSLTLCTQKKIRSIGFPAISTGVFGYPVEEAAQIAIRTIKETIDSNPIYPEHIVIVLFTAKDKEIHDLVLKKIF